MAELTTVARPYAKAVFQLAASTDLQAWSEQLKLLSSVAQQAPMQKVFASPTLTSEQQAATLTDVCGEELKPQAKNLVNILAENKRLSVLPEVARLFEELKAEKERTVDVQITSAFELGEEMQDRLATALKQKLERDVKLNASVDESLLGGVLIRAGDTVIDGSIRGRLAKLAEVMNA